MVTYSGEVLKGTDSSSVDSVDDALLGVDCVEFGVAGASILIKLGWYWQMTQWQNFRADK